MAVEVTPTPTPRFATVVRGYDRLQVDEYVDHLQRWIDQADDRAQQSEIAATLANSEADQLRRRLASVDAGTLTATPESMKALGDRVGGIMQSSFQAAKEQQRRAEDEVRARTAAAEETAMQIIAEATMRAEELSRAAEDLFVLAQEALDQASKLAACEVDEAKARGVSEGEELLERARHAAQELARRTAEEEHVQREQLQLLEQHRGRVMEEIGVLHQRLGHIGDGLSVPVPAPAPAPAPPPSERANQHAQPQKAELDAEATSERHEARHEARHEPPNDDTLVLELPTGAKPARRKVASSSR